MRTLPLFAALLVIAGCATVPPPPPPSERELLTAAVKAFMAAAPLTPTPTLWLSNEEDSECDRADDAPPAGASTPIDLLAFEVFGTQVVADRWAFLIEGHRHNYARDLKPETHKAMLVKPDTSTTVEDLCLLDEAKKRSAEKVLVYQVLGESRGAILVHFRLSNARTGLVEVSRTLLSSAAGVVDRSSK